MRVLKCRVPMCIYPFVKVFLEIRQFYLCDQGHTFINQHPNSKLWYYLNFFSFSLEKLRSILTFLMEKRESSDKIKVRTFSNNYMYNFVPLLGLYTCMYYNNSRQWKWYWQRSNIWWCMFIESNNFTLAGMFFLTQQEKGWRSCPTDTRRWINVGLVLIYRLRRRTNVKPTFCVCWVCKYYFQVLPFRNSRLAMLLVEGLEKFISV